MLDSECREASSHVNRSAIDAGRALEFMSKRFYLSVLRFECTITRCVGKCDGEDSPFFLGPTLRGAFGYALKERLCDHQNPVWREEQKECPPDCDCAYKTIFLSPAPPDLPPPYHGRTFKPHPFTLRAPWLSVVRKGMKFSFEVAVLGDAHRAIAGFIDGFVLVGIRGLLTHKWAFNFVVDIVRQLKPDGNALDVWQVGKGFTEASGSYHFLAEFIDEKAVGIFNKGVEIRLNSPLDMVIDRKTIRRLDQLEETSLAGRLASSLEELGIFWCGLPTLGGKPSLKNSSNLPVEKMGEWTYQKTRLSVQEGNTMPMSGLMGTLRIHRPRPETVRLLAALLHIGIGQNRSFGFGRYDLSPII